ncbi:insulinase family protein, partial [bacterium]|nr:insulinase family protein [bacterium]
MKIFKGLVFLLFAASLLFGEEAILPVCSLKSSVSDLGATIVSADLPGNPETAVTVAFGGGVSGEGNLLGSGLAFTMTEWLNRKLDQERLKPDCAFPETECEVILERDAVFVVVTGLKEQVKAAVKTLFEIIKAQDIDDEEFAKLKQETVAYLKKSESEEKNALMNLWRRTAFPAMMEAVPKCGYSAQAEKLEKEDLKKYMAAHFVSGNVSFVLVGSLFGSGLEELAGECLASLPEGIFIRDDRVLIGDDGTPRLSMKTANGDLSLVCLGLTL